MRAFWKWHSTRSKVSLIQWKFRKPWLWLSESTRTLKGLLKKTWTDFFFFFNGRRKGQDYRMIKIFSVNWNFTCDPKHFSNTTRSVTSEIKRYVSFEIYMGHDTSYVTQNVTRKTKRFVWHETLYLIPSNPSDIKRHMWHQTLYLTWQAMFDLKWYTHDTKCQMWHKTLCLT